MAIKLNGADLTANKLDSLNVTEEKLDNEKIYPSVITMNMRISGGAWQTINLMPITLNGRQCVTINFTDPVLTINGIDNGSTTSMDIFPGNTVEIVNNGFFTGSYGLDPGLQDFTGNLMMSNFEFAVNPTNAYISNLGAFMPNDIYMIMITVD